MQIHKKLRARILSLALSVAMVTTMMPATVFAAEGGNVAPGTSSVGTIQSFNKLEKPFVANIGKDADPSIYGLTVEQGTTLEELNLPTELTAMVARTTVTEPTEDEEVKDSGEVDKPADDTVSGNQPASPSEAEEKIEDADVPLAPEPESKETVVTTIESETIAVEWHSDKEFTSDKDGGPFIYTAELPEGYILADGVKLPQIYVFVGSTAPRATTYTLSGTITNNNDSAALPAIDIFFGDSGQYTCSLTSGSGQYTISDIPAGASDKLYIMATGDILYTSPDNITMNGNKTHDVTFENPTISGTITGSDTNAGIAATLQLKYNGNNAGDPVTAASDGTYTISEYVMTGFEYTIAVTMDGYTDGTITAFDVAYADVTGKDLTLQKEASANVAEIGTTKYATLAEAITAAQSNSGCTVKLLDNIPLAAKQTISSGTFTIDLNGKKITGPANAVALEFSGGTVIIKDTGTGGTVQGGEDQTAITVTSSAHLTINSGTFLGGAITNILRNALFAHEGTTIINGGTFTGGNGKNSGDNGGRAVAYNGGSLTINGGTFTGGNGNGTGNGGDALVLVANATNVTLKGGTYTAGTGSTAGKSIAGTSSATVASLISTGYKAQNESNEDITSGLDAESYSGTIKIVEDGGTSSDYNYEIDLAGSLGASGSGYTLSNGLLTLTGAKNATYRLHGDGGSNVMQVQDSSNSLDITLDGVTLTNPNAGTTLSLTGGTKLFAKQGTTNTISSSVTSSTSVAMTCGGGGTVEIGGSGKLILSAAEQADTSTAIDGRGVTINGATVIVTSGGTLNSMAIDTSTCTVNSGSLTVTAKNIPNGYSTAIAGTLSVGNPAPDVIMAGTAAPGTAKTVEEINNASPEFTYVKIAYLDPYTGTEAAAPSSTPSAKTATSVTLTAVTAPSGETVEYAKSTTSTAPSSDADWQTSTEFTGLTADTTYYFFARVKANDTHKAGAASAGTSIKTDVALYDYEIDLANTSLGASGSGYTYDSATKKLTLTGTAGQTYRLHGNGGSNVTSVVSTNATDITLDGVTLSNSTASNDLIALPNGATIVLKNGNIVTGTGSESIAIYCAGGSEPLTINGTGTLTAEGAKSGIFAEGHTPIAISSGTVNAKSVSGSCIYTGGSVTISGGTVTAESTNAYGISSAYGAITLSGENTVVKATGGNKALNKEPTLSDGIKAYGGTWETANKTVTWSAKEVYDYEINLADTLSATGSGYTYDSATKKLTLTGTAGQTYRLHGNGGSNVMSVTSTSATDITLDGVTLAQSTENHTLKLPDGATLKLKGTNSITSNQACAVFGIGSFTIQNADDKTPGALTATNNGWGGSAIAANYNITISGGIVTATSDMGFGIMATTAAAGTITINGGTVTATGGTNGIAVGMSTSTITFSGEKTVVKATGGSKALNAAPTLSDGIVASGGTWESKDTEVTWQKASGYTVTFNANGGSVSSASATTGTDGKLASLPTPTRSGHTFNGWFTAAMGGTQVTTSTVFTQNSTIYAQWTQNGGGSTGGGSTGGGSSSNDNPATVVPPATNDKPNNPTTTEVKTPATVDNKGNGTVIITEQNMTDAVTKAIEDAKKNSKTDDGIAVQFVVSTGGKSVNTLTVNLPKATQEKAINNKVTSMAVIMEGTNITVGFDLAAVTEINKQAKADVQLTTTRMDNSKLTGEAKTAIGNRPVFDIKATYSNGAKSINGLGSGQMMIEIPYKLQAGEVAGNLYGIYVDDNGKANYLTNSSYDAKREVLIIGTNHNSVYGVGYKASAPAFTDINGHWAKDSIEFVAARGLLSGTSNTTFSPNTGMTRAMFVTALGRLAGIDSTKYSNTKFNDVKADAYYAPYVAWATEKGITSGVSATTFNPDKNVTRQEMAVFMVNYAKAMGYTLPKTREEVKFTDAASIGSFAKDAVKAVQMAGVIVGKDGNKFDPTGTATRAEVATVLRRYVELVIDRSTAQGLDTNDSGSATMYENGKMVKSASRTVGSSTYNFNANGEAARKTQTAGVTTGNPALPAGGKKYITYTVKKGDWISKIAIQYNCTVDEIVALNGIKDRDIIFEGQQLKVPQK